MAPAVFEYLELRFVVEPDATAVYVLCSQASDGMRGVGGWHTKRFPKNIPVDEILRRMFHGNDDPVLWPQDSPERVIRVGVPGATVGFH